MDTPLTLLSHLGSERLVVTQEVWESPAQVFAVAHTPLVGPINERMDELTRFLKLRAPLTRALAGRLPGHFHLYLNTRACSTSAAAAVIRREIEREVLNAVRDMGVGDWRTIESPLIPFSFQLHRADAFGSGLFVGRREGEVDAARLARTRRALALASPALDRASSRLDATSVLILETRDRTRASGSLTADAILLAISERTDQPDVVVLVETDPEPLQAWIVADRVDLYPCGRPLPRFYTGAQGSTDKSH
jgi:hypothetical protein